MSSCSGCVRSCFGHWYIDVFVMEEAVEECHVNLELEFDF